MTQTDNRSAELRRLEELGILTPLQLAWMKRIEANVHHLAQMQAAPTPEATVTCRNCGTVNVNSKLRCVHCDWSLYALPAATETPQPACEHRPAFDKMWLTVAGEVWTRCWKCDETLSARFQPPTEHP